MHVGYNQYIRIASGTISERNERAIVEKVHATELRILQSVYTVIVSTRKAVNSLQI